MGTKQIIKIPGTRAPFINAQVVPAGIDRETGEERFWTSTWDSNTGSIGALVTVSGKSKIFRFEGEKKKDGFYGASYGGNDKMYLSCFIDEVFVLDLNTGDMESFKIDLPHSLSVSGMVYDPNTKKVFSSAYCAHDFTRKGFSFSPLGGITNALYKDIPLRNLQLRYSIKNNDHTYSFINMIPNVEILLWDPVEEKVEVVSPNFEIANEHYYFKVIRRDDGAIYLPFVGWFDPLLKKMVDGPRAKHEACWFSLENDVAYGVQPAFNGNCILYEWDLTGGEIKSIADIPDAATYSFEKTSRGKIVCINVYGFFYRIDPENSTIEFSKKLDTNQVAALDCVYRIDENRLLCTPFISQRFLEIELDTQKGHDLGRATGGYGEVLKVDRLKDKIYMASYTQGQLVEYDPNCRACFPENPRVVVHPPYKAMRPVAMCNDGENLYYSCSLKYGHLGSLLVKFCPEGGETLFFDDPLPNQMIRSIIHDKGQGVLIAGTTYHADCRSCVPVEDKCLLAKLDEKSLVPLNTAYSPKGYEIADVCGPLNPHSYLCCLTGETGEKLWVDLDVINFTYGEFNMPDKNVSAYYTGKPGVFVLIDREGNIGLWNLSQDLLIRTIDKAMGYYGCHLQDNRLYLVYRNEIHAYDI